MFNDLLKRGDRSAEKPNSPLHVLNHYYFKAPFTVAAEREEKLVTSMLVTKVGEALYPGTFDTCEEWPGVAPGTKGFNNAIAPKYFHLSSIAEIKPKPPILWIRGAEDAIVSDRSFFDLGFLGQQGYIPGWPGEDVYPPQPMVKQTRYVLESYKRNGGSYEEYVVEQAWKLQKDELVKNGFRVLTYDLRGHEESEWRAEEVNIDTYAEDLNQLLQNYYAQPSSRKTT